MKRSCLVFLGLAILWRNVISSEGDLVKPRRPALRLPWTVTVRLPRGRSYNETLTNGQPESVKKAFEDVLCGGVVVNRSLVYAPAISVEGIKPEDLVVVEQTTNRRHDVINIRFSRRSPAHRMRYALLVLRDDAIDTNEFLPIIRPSDVLTSACLVSELFTEAEPNHSGVEVIPRRGEFGFLRVNKCADNSAFRKPYEKYDPRSRSIPSFLEHRQRHYASPLACLTESRDLVLVGYYAWAFPMDDSSDYECSTDGQVIRDLMNQRKP